MKLGQGETWPEFMPQPVGLPETLHCACMPSRRSVDRPISRAEGQCPSGTRHARRGEAVPPGFSKLCWAIPALTPSIPPRGRGILRMGYAGDFCRSEGSRDLFQNALRNQTRPSRSLPPFARDARRLGEAYRGSENGDKVNWANQSSGQMGAPNPGPICAKALSSSYRSIVAAATCARSRGLVSCG